mgnify:CR=1 FL=1
MTKLIRTVIQVTVLHAAHTDAEVQSVEAMSLEQLGVFINEGDGLGESRTVSIDEIAPTEIAALCRDLGNDGTFFAQDVADSYFPAHLRSENEDEQNWTVTVDMEADAQFRTLSEAEIRRRQDICKDQARRAFAQKHERASIDIARQEDALMREMLRRC